MELPPVEKRVYHFKEIKLNQICNFEKELRKNNMNLFKKLN